MNKNVIPVIVVIVVVVLCASAVIYAPSLAEIIQRIHPIPQH